ncbi:NUMOD4 domain-containing protein [Chryseobacterium cucumeris]|uniref:NUMOD4 domain-containing protein n=1 Tax=Chryseobacterium cucumeris TaxID=1813611 RepID=UPI0023F42A64|nr:NUMOD4 domain-containing protein [Chryseobacterium cucumeris]
MKLPPEFEDQYVKEVLYNTSLKNLPGEEWKSIENYENYMISNYGRVKSTGRFVSLPSGKEWKMPELIMKLIFVKHTNSYLQNYNYSVHCSLSSEGKKYRKSVIRLVYYHFIEKFDYYDRTILISTKDENKLNIHYQNLQKISSHEMRLNMFEKNRIRNRKVIYSQAVSQYSIEGELLSDFESMYMAKKKLGIAPESIMDVINKQFLTAGGYRWFLKSYTPAKKVFIITENKSISNRVLNTALWEKLGRPSIDQNNPPACLNLSIKDLPGEHWKIIPGFDNRFAISSKGRVKRLAGWTSNGRTLFLKEQILSQIMSQNTESTYSLYCLVRNKGKNTRISISKWVYYCFIHQFDIHSKIWVVVNKSKPLWDMDVTKLSLHTIYTLLRQKVKHH